VLAIGLLPDMLPDAWVRWRVGVAAVVHEKVGLAISRMAWFNLDVVWAVALVLTGGVTLLV
jgi:hypothetical protein